MSKPKVVHMTSAHSVVDTRIFLKECRALSDAGYEVVLVGQHEADEEREGVRTRGVPRPRNRLDRMVGTSLRVLVRALGERAAIYHFHDPELIPAGILLRLVGKKVVYDAHENVSKQILGKPWIPKGLRRPVSRVIHCLELVGVRFFSGIVAATPAIAAQFPPRKTVVVQNFPILDELTKPNPTPYGERPPWIAYVGGISAVRGIGDMVTALGRLPNGSSIRLKLVGKFMPESLRGEIEALPGWSHVDYLGWQSRLEVAAVLDRSRIGLVLFHPHPNHIEAQPNKLFEYMSAGLPVIASDFPLWREIVLGASCGVVVDPLDPDAIADAIHWLLKNPVDAQHMGERGRKAVLETYNWVAEAQNLLRFYGEVLHA
jgi:glycosyltransferase involved in cell wall biosynthesis